MKRFPRVFSTDDVENVDELLCIASSDLWEGDSRFLREDGEECHLVALVESIPKPLLGIVAKARKKLNIVESSCI
jgi:hypothetical protein